MKRLYRPALIVVVTAAVIYSLVWYFFSKKFEAHVEEQLAIVQTKGFDVSFDKLVIGGFPFGYSIKVKDLMIQRGDIFKTWIEGDITFSAKLWKPQEISSFAAGTHHFEFDNIKLMGDGFALRSFTFDPMRIRFYYDDLTVKLNDENILKTEKFEYDIDFTPESNSQAYAEIKCGAKNISSPAFKDIPLGDTIQSFSLRTELQGDFQGNSAAERLLHWFKSDGSLEVKELGLTWSDLSVDGEGTLSVDEQLQPLAAFTVHIEGLDKTVDTFVEKGVLKQNIGALLKGGLNIMTLGGKSKVSLTIQDRKLSVGSIPVMEFPKVLWPGNAQP